MMSTRRSLTLFVFLIAGVLRPGRLPAQTEIRHTRPTFSIQVPAGFEPATTNQMPETLYSFFRAPAPGKTRLNFCLQSNGVIIAPKTLTLQDFPPDKRIGDTNVEEWTFADQKLSTVVSRFKAGTHELTSITIQIPIKDAGLVVSVTGSRTEEPEARRLLESLLKSLRAELFDPLKQLSDVQIRQMARTAVAKIAAIPDKLEGPAVRYFETRAGGKSCGWMRYEVTGGSDEGEPIRKLGVDAVIRAPGRPALLSRIEMQCTLHFGFRGYEQRLTTTPEKGEAIQSVERATVRGDKVVISVTRGGVKRATETPLHSRHSVLECEPLIESLGLKEGEECALTMFDPTVRSERVRVVRATGKVGEERRVEVFRLSDLAERELETRYILDKNGLIKESLNVTYGIVGIRVDEAAFEKLKQRFPK